MICERCGTVFCWDDADGILLGGNPKRFCSKECKRRDRKGLGSRRAHVQKYWQKQACDQRPKPRYASEEDALCGAADLGRIPPLRPYSCPCGGWHLTSQLPEPYVDAMTEPGARTAT